MPDDLLLRLQRAATAACDHAFRERRRPELWNEAVNWADLQCVEAQSVVNQDGRTWCRVVIEEAGPEGCSGFRQFIRDELGAAGFPDVEVETAW